MIETNSENKLIKIDEKNLLKDNVARCLCFLDLEMSEHVENVNACLPFQMSKQQMPRKIFIFN